MIKHIFELDRQAQDYAAMELATVNTGGVAEFNRLYRNKFAELIVQDCLAQVDKVDTMLDDPKEKVGVSWVGLAISKHWGLEE